MLPKVAIVGRPNVGKSSLLNLLAGRRISIVDPTAGVTRDRVGSIIELPPDDRSDEARFCELIDTGGYGIYSGAGELEMLTEDVEAQIALAMDEAQIILFLVDAQAGITPLDRQFAQLLRRRLTEPDRLLTVANKVDGDKHEADAMDAASLGFGDPLTVSCTTGRHKHELLEALSARLDFSESDETPAESRMRLAIVGKRNAGKSTFVNALAGTQRVIVSELPGTTRDSVDVQFEMDGMTFTAIDTAGVRKRKSIADDVEYYSMHRTLRSIRRADVVVLLIDAIAAVSQVDKKLGQEIQEHYRPCVIVINKWDLVSKEVVTDDYVTYLTKVLRGLDYAPIVFASAKENQHVHEAVTTAHSLYRQASRRIPTGKLNQVMRQILEQRGPTPRLGKQAKIYYVTMPSTHPPTVVLFVNRVDLFDEKYQRYIINCFRRMLPYSEVPIRLLIRPRGGRLTRDGKPIAEA